MPATTRIRSGTGAWEALVSAFAECDRVGRARCLLAGRAASYWDDLVDRLKQGPVRVGGGRVFYSDLIDNTLGTLYSPSSYRFLISQIAGAHRFLFGSADRAKRDAGLLHRATHARLPYRPRALPPVARLTRAKSLPYTLPFEGVTCADTVNPRDPRAWIHAGAVADRHGPWFGREWTWFSNLCARYPRSAHADAYEGPWTITTSSPVLLVANVHDPATPISGARFMNSRLEGSRMLTLDQWGHVAIGRSHCVTTKTAAYLVDGLLPPNGAVCRGNGQLFPPRR